MTTDSLGMVIENRNIKKGVFLATAIAPKPLSDNEWKRVSEVEEPRMREIIGKEIGPTTAALFSLKPESYKIIFAAAFVSSKSSTLVTFKAMMRYIGAIRGAYFPKSPPPTAAQLGLIKIWGAFEKQLEMEGYKIRNIRGGHRKKILEKPA
jgi:hypothetical protein